MNTEKALITVDDATTRKDRDACLVELRKYPGARQGLTCPYGSYSVAPGIEPNNSSCKIYVFPLAHYQIGLQITETQRPSHRIAQQTTSA